MGERLRAKTKQHGSRDMLALAAPVWTLNTSTLESSAPNATTSANFFHLSIGICRDTNHSHRKAPRE